MPRKIGTILYFGSWFLLALVAAVLNALNYDWRNSNVVQGVFLLLALGLIEGNVLELVILSFVAIAVKCVKPREPALAPYDNLTLIMNYNLLALSQYDIDETYENMYHAYMGNLSPTVSIVLVSAARDPRLKEYELQTRDNYRALIYDTLMREGQSFAEGDYSAVDPYRLEFVWQKYANLEDKVFLSDYLPEICNYFSQEFMCVHRVSRVLKKCGQYQDLMLLSDGDNQAFSYTSKHYYGDMARPFGELLYYESNDVRNILGRKYDYTLVLDADTRVLPGMVHQLLAIAAAHPERGIIQPAIRLNVKDNDTMFMHLEKIRQDIHEPLTRATSQILGQCGYYGKALLKNRIYIDCVIGTAQQPLERVPIDVLSHDTFEACILKPMYAPNVYLLENPCYNYITWNIREARWNRGEVLLSMYFWSWVGSIMRFLQRAFQGDKVTSPKLRTETKIDFVTGYIAYSALRHMTMKPCLLLFMLLHVNIKFHYYWVPFAIVIFLVVVFPMFAVMTRANWVAAITEIFASVIQFTPEAVIGTVRVFRAIEANICSCCSKWIPQRVIEDELRHSNPFKSSFKYLWGYMVLALIGMILIVPFLMHIFMYILFVGLFILPFYCGITSFNRDLRSSKSYEHERDKDGTSEIVISNGYGPYAYYNMSNGQVPVHGRTSSASSTRKTVIPNGYGPHADHNMSNGQAPVHRYNPEMIRRNDYADWDRIIDDV